MSASLPAAPGVALGSLEQRVCVLEGITLPPVLQARDAQQNQGETKVSPTPKANLAS
jgi:hypothetical protein